MDDSYATRRYLLNFDTRHLGQVLTDVLVIGGGVAGLMAALSAARQSHVLMITKDRLADSNTAWAQGGIAVVTEAGDTVESHIDDTLRVGCGLGNRLAIEMMARQGPECLKDLVEWGAEFDMEQGVLARGMEGGHSARRIVHALGDATGRELSRSLSCQAKEHERIRIFENCFLIDFVTPENRCLAAVTYHAQYGHQIIWAKQMILATGGAGCLYRETTNPPSATADGLAAAFRTGARLRDMEFVQFHPTSLYVAGAARALISEAVRGEGAFLVDRAGNRFMPAYHADGELAPRDVVSRSIMKQMKRTSDTSVYLDARHFPPGRFESRFPHIAELCREFDIDVQKDRIPVRPAAHYMIGGVAVDIDGRSSIEGLWACGEAAATGVHGANRLASNSLLEGLVFGKHVGILAAEQAARGVGSTFQSIEHHLALSPKTELDVPDIRNSLRALCWRNLGIERTGRRLDETLEIIDFWGRYVMDKVLDHRQGWETQNMLTIAYGIALAARARSESRGVHYRSDYPDSDDSSFMGHITLQCVNDSVRQAFEPMTVEASTD